MVFCDITFPGKFPVSREAENPGNLQTLGVTDIDINIAQWVIFEFGTPFSFSSEGPLHPPSKPLIRVIQMPNFLKIQSATGFSCDIYHKECENAKKFQKN